MCPPSWPPPSCCAGQTSRPCGSGRADVRAGAHAADRPRRAAGRRCGHGLRGVAPPARPDGRWAGTGRARCRQCSSSRPGRQQPRTDLSMKGKLRCGRQPFLKAGPDRTAQTCGLCALAAANSPRSRTAHIGSRVLGVTSDRDAALPLLKSVSDHILPADYGWRAVASAVQMTPRGLSASGRITRLGGRLGAVRSAAAMPIRPGSASLAGLWVVVFAGDAGRRGPGVYQKRCVAPPSRHPAMTVSPGTRGSHWRSRPGAAAVSDLGWRTCGASRHRLDRRGWP